MIPCFRRFRPRSITCILAIILLCLLLNSIYENGIPRLRIEWSNGREPKEETPFFHKKHNFDCSSALRTKEKGKLANFTSWSRPVDTEYNTWNKLKDCQIIKGRNFYPKQPRSERESRFPLAYVIMAEANLEQLETMFSSIYAPQNYYCFHVDFKAHFMVHDFVKKFSTCFDTNHVFVADQSVPIAETSVSILYAQRACFLKLAKTPAKDWRYALTIESRDFPLRTNRELVEILMLHNGANDVELVEPLTYRYEKLHRVMTDEFGHPHEMEETTNRHQPPPIADLKIYKGSLASALSRRFVDFVLHTDPSTYLLSWLGRTYMPSEIYLSTLNHNEFLNASGGYPGQCLQSGKRKAWVSRFTMWNTYKEANCQGQWVKGHCIFGVANLGALNDRPEFFAHEFDQKISPLVIDCLHERVYNRTYLSKDPLEHLRPAVEYYRKLSAVQYQNWKTKIKEKDAVIAPFSCVTCDDCEH